MDQEESMETTRASLPLCVDLDGTLVKTDMLLESVYALGKRSPFSVLWLPCWLLKGKAYLKQQIARRVRLDVSRLPYHPEFLEFLREEYRCGRQLILATASDMSIATQIATHLGVFAEVLASDGKTNLSGENKLHVLQDRFGLHGFDYAGNAKIDLKIWPHARAAIVVNPSSGLMEKVQRVTSLSHVFDDREKRFCTFFKNPAVR